MIKANELRIGNWVGLPFGGNQQVTGGDIHQLDLLRFFSPIPITPEILEKAGFEFKNGYGWRYGLITILKSKDLSGKFMFLGIVTQVLYIDSLHQLQNLYFALTGEELTINL